MGAVQVCMGGIIVAQEQSLGLRVVGSGAWCVLGGIMVVVCVGSLHRGAVVGGGTGLHGRAGGWCGEVKLAVGAYSSGEEASSSQRWRVNLAGRSVRLRQWWRGLLVAVVAMWGGAASWGSSRWWKWRWAASDLQQ